MPIVVFSVCWLQLKSVISWNMRGEGPIISIDRDHVCKVASILSSDSSCGREEKRWLRDKELEHVSLFDKMRERVKCTFLSNTFTQGPSN